MKVYSILFILQIVSFSLFAQTSSKHNPEILRILCYQYANDKEMTLLKDASKKNPSLQKVIRLYLDKKDDPGLETILPISEELVKQTGAVLHSAADSLDYIESLLWLSGEYGNIGLEDKQKLELEKAHELLKYISPTNSIERRCSQLDICIEGTLLSLQDPNFEESQYFCHRMSSYIQRDSLQANCIDIESAFIAYNMAIYYGWDDMSAIMNNFLRHQIETSFSQEHPYHLSLKFYSASYLVSKEQFGEAIDLLNTIIEDAPNMAGINCNMFAIYELLGYCYDMMVDFQKAYLCYENAIKEWKYYRIQSIPRYWDIVFTYVMRMLDVTGGQAVDKALAVIDELLQDIEKHKGRESFEYIQKQSLKIYAYRYGGDLERMEESLQEYETGCKSLLMSTIDKVHSLQTIALEYAYLKYDNKAEELFKGILFILKISKMENSLDYADTLFHLGRLYQHDRMEEAESCFMEALEVLEKQEYIDKWKYISVYTAHLSVLRELSRFSSVIERTESFLTEFQNDLDVMESVYFPEIMYDALIACSESGQKSKEKTFEALLLSQLERLSDNLLSGISSLFYALYFERCQQPDIEKAACYAMKAEKLLSDDIGNMDAYLMALDLCCLTNDLLGKYDRMQYYTDKTLSLYETRIGTLHPEYYNAILRMVKYEYNIRNISASTYYMSKLQNMTKQMQKYKEADKYNIAIDTFPILFDFLAEATEEMRNTGVDLPQAITDNFQEMISLTESIIKTDLEEHKILSPKFYSLAFSYGDYKLALEEWKSAENYYKLIADATKGKNQITYASAMGSLAKLYWNKKEWNHCISYAETSYKIHSSMFGEKHLPSNGLLQILTYANIHLGNLSDAGKYAIKRFELLKYNVGLQFTTLTESARIGLSNTYNLNNMDQIAILRRQYSESLAKEAYDAALFYKGLLLRSSTHIRKAIYESGNTQLINAYNQLSALKEKVQNTSVSMTPEEYNKLNASLEQSEKILMSLSEEYSKNVKKQNYSWEDVCNALEEGELAIEYIVSSDSINRFYGALLLKKDFNVPVYVELFTERDLQNLKKRFWRGENESDKVNRFYDREELYGFIVKPMEQYLEGVHTIYYSPTHSLNTIAMAALCNEQDQRLGSLYNLRLVSTTGEIIDKKEAVRLKKADLYGGIIYNESSDGTGEGWRYLENTPVEVSVIEALLKERQVESQKFLGKFATESQFKRESHNQPDILHIATHGYCYAENVSGSSPEAGAREHEEYVKQFGENQNNAMFRAGLIFANGNETWLGKKQTNPEEDGILLANEIAEMDLRNVSLAVLSACKTGLGETNNSEGVYGLQRAFKLAGVQSIIMSLWEVNDESGKLFMEYFYSNVCDGMERHIAFNEAQKKLRAEYPRTNHWAAFVMLD